MMRTSRREEGSSAQDAVLGQVWGVLKVSEGSIVESGEMRR